MLKKNISYCVFFKGLYNQMNYNVNGYNVEVINDFNINYVEIIILKYMSKYII